MSGFEVFGLISGLPGLLTSCVNAYRLVVAFKGLQHEAEILRTKVVLEQAKFSLWLENSGFGPDSKSPTIRLPPLLQEVAEQTIKTMKSCLDDLGSILENYQLDEINTKTRPRFVLSDKFFKPHGTGQNLPVQKKQPSVGKRIAWAAADEGKFRTRLGDLREFNEDLETLETLLNRGKGTRYNLPSRVLPYVLGESNLNLLIEATADLDTDLSTCAVFKKTSLGIARLSLEEPDPHFSLLYRHLDISNVRNTTGQARSLADFTKNGVLTTVMVEEKSWADVHNESAEKFVEKRVQDIVSLLAQTPKPAKFRVLDCLGYVPNRQKKSFSFIFSLPSGVDIAAPPLSLEYFLSKSGTDTEKPNLEVRFSLAHTLANSLLLLQACGVLHKGIHHGNVIFFKDPRTAGYPLSKPFLSGFDFARLHGKDFRSESFGSKFAESRLYSHPDYSFSTSKRYLRVFDIYSLGILLLQIGLWKSLDELRHSCFAPKRAVVDQIQRTVDSHPTAVDQQLKQFIRQYEERLRRQESVAQPDTTRANFRATLFSSLNSLLPETGPLYTDVVARCLSGDISRAETPDKIVAPASEEEDEDEAGTQEAFLTHIVEALEKITV